jgi:choloylglycine hydrolase
VPRGYAFTGETPLGPGKTWTGKYAVVGGIAFNNLAIMDGMNEKGLAAGAFYFPTFAEYAETTPENRTVSMSMADFTNWVLTSFSSVGEVKAAIEAGDVAIGWPPQAQPFHYVVYDATGASIAIEPIGGKLKIYDNPLGAMTNSPTFDWHMTNLRNYIALNPRNVPPLKIDGMTFRQFGEGSGMLGLPGDITPPSRFVRAAVFSVTAIPEKDAEHGVLQVFHILNNFDTGRRGAVGSRRGGAHRLHMLTVARDPQALRYYWKTCDDQAIRMVDMKQLDLNGKSILMLSTKGQQSIIDSTRDMK